MFSTVVKHKYYFLVGCGSRSVLDKFNASQLIAHSVNDDF